jgi:hypothetical protein
MRLVAIAVQIGGDPSVHQSLEMGQLARLNHRVEQVPGSAVEADEDHVTS